MDISDLNFKPCVCGYQVFHLFSYVLGRSAQPAIRSVDSAGIISNRTSTVDVLHVAESTPTTPSNSSLLRKKSTLSAPRFTYKIKQIHDSHSHKRLTQQKKQRERERKELDALNRRHLANVRVVQRNVVYVVGIGPRFAKEEVCYSSHLPTSRLQQCSSI